MSVTSQKLQQTVIAGAIRSLRLPDGIGPDSYAYIRDSLRDSCGAKCAKHLANLVEQRGDDFYLPADTDA